jgi:hypothetical protein
LGARDVCSREWIFRERLGTCARDGECRGRVRQRRASACGTWFEKARAGIVVRASDTLRGQSSSKVICRRVLSSCASWCTIRGGRDLRGAPGGLSRSTWMSRLEGGELGSAEALFADGGISGSWNDAWRERIGFFKSRATDLPRLGIGEQERSTQSGQQCAQYSHNSMCRISTTPESCIHTLATHPELQLATLRLLPLPAGRRATCAARAARPRAPPRAPTWRRRAASPPT